MANTTRLLVLYHSSYGHVETLAYAEAHGARAVEGVRICTLRAPARAMRSWIGARRRLSMSVE